MRGHGALLDVHGVGVLLLGPSGVGKSECALELVSRGHRLVADDVFEAQVAEDGRVIGRAPERVRHHMEIRGVGIVYIPDLYGPRSVRNEIAIELVCRLEPLATGVAYERVGFERPEIEIGGASLPQLTLPARAGGSMATVVELAAREHRQRREGVNAARRLDARLRSEMRGP